MTTSLHSNIFYCDKCKYMTIYKSNLKTHLKTKKHTNQMFRLSNNSKQLNERMERLKILKQKSTNTFLKIFTLLREEIETTIKYK